MMKCTPRTAQCLRRTIAVKRRAQRCGVGPVELQEGEVLSFVTGGEVAIQCQGGILWVTQERDLRDHILRAGERFLPDKRRRVVVWAMSDALVMLGEINTGEKGAR